MKSRGVSICAGPHTAVEPEKVRKQLERILASNAFATAKSARRFLRYVVEESLAGRGDQIKEYVVGAAVFARGDEYDPRVDAVVRVEATRLRNRLRDYYQKDGRGDGVHIELPKGRYVPLFQLRQPETPPKRPFRHRLKTIAKSIRAELPPREKIQFGDVDPDAYEFYLRGRFYSQHQNRDDNEAAILNLERAVAIDPTFASAFAELAQTYVWKLFLFAPGERQWEEKAFIAVEKALSLDPGLAVAYVARGRLLWTPANHFPHHRAIREYRRALDMDPNLDEARNQLALIYCHIGYFDQALEESQKAVLANPNNNLAVYRTGQTLVFRGDYVEALSVLGGIPEDVNPSLVGYQIAWALFNLGRQEEASVKIAQLARNYPPDSGGLFTSVQAVLAASVGDERAAEAKIELAVEIGKGFGHFHHTAYHIATALALMKKAERAIEWLETAAGDGFPCYPLFERDTNLDDLRRNAHFVAFMVELREQWVGYGVLF